MINTLMSSAFSILFLLFIIWLFLTMLSHWQSFNSVRRGYEEFIKEAASGVARFLWTPRFERQGGGRIAHPYMPYPDDSSFEGLDEEDTPC